VKGRRGGVVVEGGGGGEGRVEKKGRKGREGEGRRWRDEGGKGEGEGEEGQRTSEEGRGATICTIFICQRYFTGSEDLMEHSSKICSCSHVGSPV